METLLFVWMVISSIVLATWLARRKGHDASQGFFFGLLFGPLGVLAIGLAPTARERAEAEAWAAKQVTAAKADYSAYIAEEQAAHKLKHPLDKPKPKS